MARWILLVLVLVLAGCGGGGDDPGGEPDVRLPAPFCSATPRPPSCL